MKYPIFDFPIPWLNLRELGQIITLDGVDISAVVSTDSLPEDLILGSAGFEAYNPYILVSNPDIESMGDLHGKTVVIDSVNYTVRNVNKKPEKNYTRLVLNAR